MKEQFQKEYMRRLKAVLKSKLSERILAVSTWAVSVLRYHAGILRWNKDEIAKLDRRTRKMTMYGALHPKSDVNRIYLPRARGGRGLISCERCIRSEENNMGWYVTNSIEPLQKGMKSVRIVDVVNCVKPEEFKKKRVEDGEKSWSEKMYGQFLRELDETDVDKDRTWDWIKRSDLKAGTETLIFAAQEQVLRTNYVKFHVDKTVESPLCRMCNEKAESLSHLVSECSKFAQRV